METLRVQFVLQRFVFALELEAFILMNLILPNPSFVLAVEPALIFERGLVIRHFLTKCFAFSVGVGLFELLAVLMEKFLLGVDLMKGQVGLKTLKLSMGL